MHYRIIRNDIREMSFVTIDDVLFCLSTKKLFSLVFVLLKYYISMQLSMICAHQAALFNPEFTFI